MTKLNTTKRLAEDDEMDVDDYPDGGPSTLLDDHNYEETVNMLKSANIDPVNVVAQRDGSFMAFDQVYVPPPVKPPLTLDTTEPRLIISHIVNENFKSYAGVQYLGPFHKSFTSIIGPNGSGKSNVIDSMLFVFGYRAAKIRSKKVSVLIHSSSKYPNVKSTSVAVHFCKIIDRDENAFDIVPNTQIVVSRTAFKDSSSFYCLNGRRVPFKKVADILSSNGIDLEFNRFLILQGEVEQIALMKPKSVNENEPGMLEYLEDIIGTSIYQDSLQNLTSIVENLTENRKEKLIRVRLVEQEKIKLEQPMREAVDLMNLTNNYLRTRNMVLQKYIQETNKIIQSKEEDLAKLKAKLADIDENLKKAEDELKEKNDIFKEGTKKYDVLRKKKEELTEKLQVCKRKAVTTLADLTQSNKKQKNLEVLIEQERGKLIELELIPEKNQREIGDCEALLVRHTEQKAKAEEELQTTVASVRTQTQGLQETKDRLQAKLMDLKKIVDEANNRCKLAESELKLYLSTEQKEVEKLEKLQQAYEKAAATLEEKRPIQEVSSRTLPENESKLSEISKKLQRLKQEEGKIISALRPLRTQLEESRQAMSANTSRNRVLNAVMNEKRHGRIPGIFGRLGDLGAIEARYDVAISTCCGALDNIVVDTVETAQACVEHLKRHNIGRTTFIALDKQEHLRATYERRRSFPEDVPRLFDLVTVRDQRVLPAFYYALHNTLVANDLEQATRIAYGRTRYRVVTLGGDVIEIAGTMSGGGKTTMRGKMSSSVQQDTSEQDPIVMRANEEKLAGLERRLGEIREEQSDLEETLAAQQRNVRDGKIMLNKLNIELKSLTEQVPVMKNQIEQQKAKVAASKVDAVQKANLEAAVEAAQEQLNTAKENAGEVEEQVHEVDTQISAVAGGKVKDLQKAVNDLVKKIDKINSEITKLRVAINTSKRNANKSKDKITHMETDLRETTKTIEALNKQKKELTLESTQLQKESDEIEEKINEGTDEFSELKQEIHRLQNKENKFKTQRLEANDAVTKMEKSLQECQRSKPQWEKDLLSLKLEEPGIEGIPGIEPLTPLATYTVEELEEVELEELRHRQVAQKNRIGDKKPNIQAIQDYKAKEELYLQRVTDLENITKQRNTYRDVLDVVKKRRMNEFLRGFNIITGKLKEMYQMITLGGDAELELVDSLDPFTEGIIFSVRPPNKSWKNISNLSGGEKTLSSLALVFALHYYKPTPLYVMDEIDAALDFKNVSIVANYIKERTRNAQFIIISLRYNMFEVSNRLVGIYKTDDCTQSVAVENKIPPELIMDIVF